MTDRPFTATERPATVMPGRVTPGDRPAAPARASAHRRPAASAMLSPPARAGLLLSASAAVYAVTLASVSGWQADAAGATAAARATGLDAVTRARAANDQLDATTTQLDAEARRLVDTYGSAAQDVAAYQARLDELSTLVAEVQGRAAALPARIQLPVVTVHGAIAGSTHSSRAPATSGRTGASGAAKP